MNHGVSCICLTYGRTELLEEAVESFRRQLWDGPKELVVVNDHPGQELICENGVGEILIVNLGRRVRTLGEKRNFATSIAKYDYLFVWDDDDIHLPWRIEETMRGLTGRNYFKCPHVWISSAGELLEWPRREAFLFHGAAAYSRHLFAQLGGYRCINGGEDQDFERRLRLDPGVSRHWKLANLPLDRLYYIYRRNHGHYHTSGCVDLREINPKVREGRYELRPCWRKDYCEEIASRLASIGDRDRISPRRSTDGEGPVPIGAPA
jgi:glycosyltransferase involved in cell wall biosynthesis